MDCVAVADALDGLLLYGASASILEAVCMELRASIRATGVRNVDQVWLGSTETEDSLWGTPGVPGWSVRGVLVPPADTTRIVTIPDLRGCLCPPRALPS